MIGTQLYKGQGFGNQLWTYAVTRSIAKRNGYKFAITGREFFKGNKFLSLDFGEPINTDLSDIPVSRVPSGFDQYYVEKKIMHPVYNCDISPFDLNLYNVPDGTFIDGNMQSEKYLMDNRDTILDWFNVVSPVYDGCTIHFRGTEYRGLKDVLVPVEYYKNAIAYLQDKFGELNFRVVTDDFALAKQYFPSFPIIGRNRISNFIELKSQPFKAKLKMGPNQAAIGRDFGMLQNSKYLVIPNSSFSWWAAWTNRLAKEVVAPKYWARHNISNGFWSTGDILTQNWTWLDKSNKFFTYEKCLEEKVNNVH
jgi:hypothetical protein